jgi:hypothetical protein
VGVFLDSYTQPYEDFVFLISLNAFRISSVFVSKLVALRLSVIIFSVIMVFHASCLAISVAVPAGFIGIDSEVLILKLKLLVPPGFGLGDAFPIAPFMRVTNAF